MSDISFSPGAMPRNSVESPARKPGLASFHTFEEQKEENSSRSKLIAGVAVAVMFAAVGIYGYEASNSHAPAKPAPVTSMPAPAAPSVATTPAPPAAVPSTPAPVNNAVPAPANDMTPPVAAPVVVTHPVRVPAHARVVHTTPASSDNAMRNRLHASDNAPANIAPPTQSPTLTPDTIAPSVAPSAPAPIQAAPAQPSTNASPSTPAPATPAPTSTPDNSSNTQTPAPAPSTDPSTN